MKEENNDLYGLEGETSQFYIFYIFLFQTIKFINSKSKNLSQII